MNSFCNFSEEVFKKYWPIILIFCIWFIFSSPYFINNKIPFASSYQVNFFSPWSAYPQFAGPVKNNAMPDVIGQIYPWKHFTIQTFKAGQISLWNPYSFSGTPHLANYQSAVFSPFNLLFFLLPFVDAWSIAILLQPLLAGIFMYLLMKTLSVNKIGALISSIAFMFCGFITTWMAYGTLGYAVLFLPLMLYAVEMFFKTNNRKFLFILSISIPLSFFSGHFQISLYVFSTLIAYIVYKYFSTKNKRSVLTVLLYTFFGLLISLVQILPSIELYSQTLRSSIFQKGEVIPWGYLSTLISPDFLGNPVTRNDWFGHYAEWNAYIGLIPLTLAFYAFTSKKDTRTFFFLFIGILAILLAFQTPILDLLIASRIPVLSTSAASRIIVLFSFSFAVLSGFGFEFFVEDVEKKKFKKIILWLGGFIIIFIILWFIVLFKLILPLDKIIIAKRNLILPTTLFSFFILSISFLFIEKKFKFNRNVKQTIYFFIVILIAFDLLRFASKWQTFDSKNLAFIDVPVSKEFKKISGYERIIGNYGAEVAVYYGLPSIEGYDATYIKRYGDFVASFNNKKVEDFDRSIISFSRNGINTSKAINLLGVKYLIYKFSDGRNSWTFPFWEYPKQFVLIYKDQAFEVYKNNEAFPRAFLVNNYEVIPDQNKIIKTLFSQGFNMREKIILEKDPGVVKSKNNPAKLEITKYSPNEIIIKTEVKNDSLLFLSDSYYDGWKAYQDGKEIPIYRANYAFRAVSVNAGSHVIEFSYDPLSLKIGLLLAIIGFGGLLALFVPKR